MSIEITIPSLGESITEATIAKWRKKKGDIVIIDEILLDIETDKVSMEITAPKAGVLNEILADEGSVVKVKEVVGLIEESDSASNSASSNKETVTIAPSNAAPERIKEQSPIASPAASKIAIDTETNLNNIIGTGKDGRITKGDVITAQYAGPAATVSDSNINLNKDNETKANIGSEVISRENRIKMSRLRKTIATRLKESQNTAAILTTFNEVDMSMIMKIRQMYQEKFQKKYGIKLGFMSFFIKACIQALKEIPAVNAEISGDDIIYKNYYDIGVAVGTENGLVVPIVKDADSLSFSELEKSISNLGQRAREGKLSIKDLTGGTFSITNGGIYGSMLSTPIINPPQSAILGMHNIIERPWVVNGEIKIRPIMYIALSYDHRIIDGKEAVTFLSRAKEMLENPERMLLDI